VVEEALWAGFGWTALCVFTFWFLDFGSHQFYFDYIFAQTWFLLVMAAAVRIGKLNGFSRDQNPDLHPLSLYSF
jgi:hypothetical protein